MVFVIFCVCVFLCLCLCFCVFVCLCLLLQRLKGQRDGQLRIDQELLYLFVFVFVCLLVGLLVCLFESVCLCLLLQRVEVEGQRDGQLRFNQDWGNEVARRVHSAITLRDLWPIQKLIKKTVENKCFKFQG